MSKINYHTNKLMMIIANMIIIIYMIVGRNYMLATLENHEKISKNILYSSRVDIDKIHTFLWEIKSKDWGYVDGVAKLYIEFKPEPGEKGKEYWKKEFQLKTKINIYAKTENGIEAPRLIKNYFYPSDEPMAKESKLWSGWSDEKSEYPLGCVIRFPKEDLFIELTIQVPDSILNQANPRLKIVGNYDPAVLGFIPFIKFFRDIGFIISVMCLLLISKTCFTKLQS